VLCRRMRPALVITAIVMPEKDGIEIIRELAREMPDLPILAITGVAKGGIVFARRYGARCCCCSTKALQCRRTADSRCASAGSQRYRRHEDRSRSRLGQGRYRMAG
jgi:DNA-binding NarL/FixJ family response regulator